MEVMGIYSDIIFPKIEPLITRGLWRERQRLLQDARERVLEIGPGTGENFRYLSPEARSYLAVDRSISFTQIAFKKSRHFVERVPITVLQGEAEELPFRSGSFDTVICFLVLCSVKDLNRSLAEIHRVLNDGGRLVFFEHVLSSDTTIARLQYFISPLWKIIGCGCRLDRNTASEINKAGFDFIRILKYRSARMGPRFTSEVIEGAAVKIV
jgi:ubiquinone/menaquinone biosynthesis C-methylase UbiE